MSHTVLVADNDRALCHDLAGELAADGYQTHTASSPGALALQLRNHGPDLVVLGDFEGPGAAARLLSALRAGDAPFHGLCAETPAIVLAKDGGQLALLRAFDAGADDFLAKPVNYLELRARIRAVIARAGGERIPSLRRVAALEIDSEGHRAAYAGRALALSQLEFAHKGRAAARHLGLQDRRREQNSRCPRMPAPKEARTGRRYRPGRKPPRRRLRPHNRRQRPR